MNEERIAELEDALTASDEYLQELEALNAELLAQLERCKNWLSTAPGSSSIIDEIRWVIAKAEARE
jgi:hypothetical protein